MRTYVQKKKVFKSNCLFENECRVPYPSMHSQTTKPLDVIPLEYVSFLHENARHVPNHVLLQDLQWLPAKIPMIIQDECEEWIRGSCKIRYGKIR